MIQGLFGNLMKRNETTGLSPMQNFAQALDPLILPQMRMGEAIRQRGLQRVQDMRRNKTIQELEERANNGDAVAQRYLQGIRSGAIDMKTGFAGYLNEIAANERLQKEINARAALAAAKTPAISEIEKRYNFFVSKGMLPEKALEEAMKKSGGININTKGADKFDELDAKSLVDVFTAGATAKSSLSKIDRLADLLSRTPTGAGANLKVIAGDFGIEAEGLDDLQAARALINQLVPAQRPAGSGPMSDADLELFKQSLPRIINTPRGNEIILETMRGIAEYDAMGAAIVQEYRSGVIDKQTAFQRLLERPDPFAAQVNPSSYF